jgi:hypothetical protein
MHHHISEFIGRTLYPYQVRCNEDTAWLQQGNRVSSVPWLNAVSLVATAREKKL